VVSTVPVWAAKAGAARARVSRTALQDVAVALDRMDLSFKGQWGALEARVGLGLGAELRAGYAERVS
jgi:hypothetical protein